MYGLRAVLANQLDTDDSFVFNRVLGRIRESVSHLPVATAEDDALLIGLMEVLIPFLLSAQCKCLQISRSGCCPEASRVWNSCWLSCWSMESLSDFFSDNLTYCKWGAFRSGNCLILSKLEAVHLYRLQYHLNRLQYNVHSLIFVPFGFSRRLNSYQ